MPLFGPPDVKKLKARKDVHGLIEALGYQRDEYERYHAAEALGDVGDRRAVDPLIAALEDHHKLVRRNAGEALGKIGDVRAVDALVGALETDDSGFVRACAVAPLVAAFTDTDEDVRTCAAISLVKIGRPAVEPLVGVLESRDWTARRAAAETLIKLGWQPDMTARGAAYWEVMGEWGKCVEIGAPAVGPLFTTLTHDDMYVRRAAAAEALGRIGAPAVAPLIAALADPQSIVRESAAEALGKIGDARGVAPLIAALEDEKRRVRKAAAAGLVTMLHSGGLGSEDRALLLEQSAAITLHVEAAFFDEYED